MSTDTTTAAERADAPEGDATVPPFRYGAELATEIEWPGRTAGRPRAPSTRPNPSGPLAPTPDAPVAAGQALPAGHVPLPVRHGPARRAPAGLHRHRRAGPLHADDRPQRAAHHRLRRVRAARRAVRRAHRHPPAHHHRGRTSSATGRSCAGWVSPTTSAARGHHRSASSSAGPSGSSLSCSTPGTTRRGGRARPIAELVAEFDAGDAADPGRPAVVRADPRRAAPACWTRYRLAYIDEAPVNWCPGLGTVLSNEEVTADGRSEIGNFPVFRRNLRQWMMRITAYADRLIDDLDRLDWPESVKSMQRNWIGRSDGRQRHLPGVGRPAVPPTSSRSSPPARTRCSAPPTWCWRPSTRWSTRIAAGPGRTGTDPRWTGGAATPAEAVADYRAGGGAQVRAGPAGEQGQDRRLHRAPTPSTRSTTPGIPVFIADYVLMGYGTGAIMAVPGQDTRDWDFATAFGLPIVRTVQPPADHPDGEAFTGDGPGDQQRQRRDLPERDGCRRGQGGDHRLAGGPGRGRGARTQYKLRDWLFSRQRYWGEPFPIVYDADGARDRAARRRSCRWRCPRSTTTRRSPSTRTTPTSEPEPPLARATEWVDGRRWTWATGPQRYRRELNVMPQWAGSCWYELRYLDPTNDKTFVDPDVEQYWMGKDPARRRTTPAASTCTSAASSTRCCTCCTPGSGTRCCTTWATSAREEPFRRLFNQGYIQAYAYTDERGVYVPAEEVVEAADGVGFTWNGAAGAPGVREDGQVAEQRGDARRDVRALRRRHVPAVRDGHGPDGHLPALADPRRRRLAALPAAAVAHLVDEQTGRARVTDAEPDDETLRLLHRTIAGVHADYAGAALQHRDRQADRADQPPDQVLGAPGAAVGGRAAGADDGPAGPAHRRGAVGSGWATRSRWRTGRSRWPTALLVAETVEYPIQVNGKVRSRITVPADAAADEVRGGGAGRRRRSSRRWPVRRRAR